MQQKKCILYACFYLYFNLYLILVIEAINPGKVTHQTSVPN